VPPVRFLGGKIVVPEASTLLCLMAFLISTFRLLYFPRYWGSQIYTRGPYAPWTPPSGEIFVPKASTLQYLIVFYFNILALVVSAFLGGSQIYVRGPCASLYAPEGKIICIRGEYVTMSKGFLISTF